jgi:hypothetical protein
MADCAVIDANNNMINFIVADPSDLPPDGCKLVEIPVGYYWDATTASVLAEVISSDN